MKSPFPGMDPYLEEHWGDVHTRFMVYASSQLNQQLPSDLQARVEESLSVESVVGKRLIYPDVRVIESAGSTFEQEFTPAAVAVAEPFEVVVPDETRTERHIEIIDTGSGNRVVTAIELLSPANKLGDAGRDKYERKQTEYIQGSVNLVEIDLLRAGAFVLAMPEENWTRRWTRRHQTPTYKVCIRRACKPDRAAGIGISLREPLPNIPIPLRPRETEVVLQLQPLIDDCYRDGRYASLDYRSSPVPPLDNDDAKWADELLRTQGRR